MSDDECIHSWVAKSDLPIQCSLCGEMYTARKVPAIAIAKHRDMTELARSFHVLEDAPGLDPWEPCTLDVWASHPLRGESTRYAAQFVLHVWNAHHPWQCGQFNMMDALAKWDDRNRHAWQCWARAPWRG